MTSRTDSRIGVLLALLSALLWGVSGAVAAGAFSEVSPARVAETRALLAVVVLVPFAWWRGLLNPGDRIWWLMALGVNLAVVNVTFYWAIDRLGVGPGATIQFLGPVLVLAWMVVVQRRSVNRAAWGAAAAAVFGVALVTEAWQLEGSDWVGVLAGFAAAATFASYLLLGEHLARDLAPITVVAWGFLFALGFWLIVQPLWMFPTDISGDAWAALVWVGIIGTVIPFIAELEALARVAAGIVGVIATTEPVFGAIAAWFLLDQQLGALQIVGALMVVAAVASIQRWGIPETEVPLEAAR
jgi:drug/metabolite transporter (DMT)-like permease